MLTVVADVLILRLAELVVIIPLAQVASKMGLPKAAILGNFLMALRYALLALSTQFPYLIFSAAIVQGIEISAFTPAYDTMFSSRASRGKVGRDVGAFTFILKLSYALLPVLAGGLIVTFGFAAAFAGAMAFLILSNVPLLSISWKEKLTYPTIRHFFRWTRKEADPRILLALAGKYFNDVGAELWPIYLIIIFGKVERLGVIMSIALLVSLVITYFSGWFVDHSKKNIPFILGGVLLALFWILRMNMTLITMILALEIAQRVVESFFYPSFDAYMYRISKQLDTFSFHVYREAFTCMASLLVWTILGSLFLFYGTIWNWIFILGAVGIALSTLLYTTKSL
jgi:MFS family permease